MFPVGIVGRRPYRPYFTFFLLVINAGVFIVQFIIGLQGEAAYIEFFERYALSVCQIGEQPFIHNARNGLFSLFLHGSPVHLLSNMTFLWIFGPRVEEYFGHKRYAIFYLAMGFMAHLFHILFAGVTCDISLPGGGGIMIGASGAIAGVMGAFLFLYPGARVRTALILRLPWIGGIPIGFINLYAVIYLVIWIVLDIFGLLSSEPSNVAHWAHIGGFVTGFLFIFIATMFKPAPRTDAFEYLDE